MKLITLPKLFLLTPVALCLAQTPAPKPATPAPAPPATAPKAAIALEDIPGTDSVVLTVGDEKMTKSEFERLLSGLPDQVKARAQGPGGKRQIAEQVAQLLAMAQEAKKRGLDKTPETKQLIAFQVDNVLANALFREMSTTLKVDDAAMKAYYEKHKNEYEELTASHILIRYKGSPVPVKAGGKDLTEAEALAKAQEIKKRLAAGEDFAKVATAESDDAQSGKEGGSLHTFGRGSMVPAFEEAAFAQPVGTVGEPVKTQFGYHIIKVEKHSNKSFDEVKATIEQKIKPEMAQQAVENVRKQAAVTMNDSYFSK